MFYVLIICKVFNYYMLQVWTAGNGPRIAAFNVGKSCQLICPGYGYLGLNNVTSRGVKTKSFQCALLDPSGSIKTLEVPFHLALRSVLKQKHFNTLKVDSFFFFRFSVTHQQKILELYGILFSFKEWSLSCHIVWFIQLQLGIHVKDKNLI